MMVKRLLEGKTVIVTGTARGIGKKMAEKFAASGASVFALARTETDTHKSFCEELENSYHVVVTPIYFDMTDYEAMKEAERKIRSFHTPIDGLVNNAGISPDTALMQMTTISTLRNTMETNFMAPYIFTKYIVKMMMKNRKGSVVNIASIRGVDPNAGDSAYGASKAALIMMTKTLAAEVGSFGIRANVICPGLTETDMISQLQNQNRTFEMEATSLGKFGLPDDIADAALFLLSDLSSFVTGQAIRVDGGVTTVKKRI